MQTARRAGFSLIEALVVLAIGGMALAVIFSIGIKAGDTGFSLGRRAMSVADADVAISDLRAIIRSLSLRPPAAIVEGVDRPIVAGPDRLEADGPRRSRRRAAQASTWAASAARACGCG